MVLFELLQLARVFLDYLRIEYLWHALIMPLTNRNGIMPPRPRPSFPSFLAGAASSHGLFWCMRTQRAENELQGHPLAGVLALSGRGFRALALIMTFAASGRLL